MSYVIKFPTGYFPLPFERGPNALGLVYIGEVDEDPTVEVNRINVTVLQEDGTQVVIPPAGQPLTLSAGGQFIFQGSIVQISTAQRYSMAIHSEDSEPLYYFPSAESPFSAAVELPAVPSDPSPLADSGYIYTKIVLGLPELFYEDDEGNVTQITSDGGVLAPPSTLDAAGTVMAFFMSAPPTGWTKITTHNDAMVRIVSGTGGGSGGDSSPISIELDFDHLHSTGSTALTIAQMPAHTHVTNVDNKDNVAANTSGHRVGSEGNAQFGMNITSSSAGSGDPHNHGNTGTAVLQDTITVRYLDFILAEKG